MIDEQELLRRIQIQRAIAQAAAMHQMNPPSQPDVATPNPDNQYYLQADELEKQAAPPPGPKGAKQNIIEAIKGFASGFSNPRGYQQVELEKQRMEQDREAQVLQRVKELRGMGFEQQRLNRQIQNDQAESDYRARVLQNQDADIVLKRQQMNRPVEISAGASMYSPEGKLLATAPVTEKPTVAKNIDPLSQEGRDAQKEIIDYRNRNAPDNKRGVAVVGPDGKPVFVKAGEEIGMQPASQREQGRQVISGDANNIADIDDAIGQLGVLKKETMPPGSTGVAAQLGAMVPNFVTELTGWGADAKSRQAVIQRVKQIIGKGLEGGVLRKEDEIKYKDILPTIGDVKEVVASKLAGLDSMLAKKKQNRLDSLEDANYDVSKFRDRDKGGGKADPLGIR